MYWRARSLYIDFISLEKAFRSKIEFLELNT